MAETHFTAREVLEIRGSYMYFIAICFVMVIGSLFQIIANVELKEVLSPLAVNGLCALLAFGIYRRKKGKKKAILLSVIVGLITALAPIATKYNYGVNVGWTFAAQSYNTSIVLIFYIVALQWLYNKKILMLCASVGIINWALFVYMAYLNGANFYLYAMVDGKGVTDGVVILREIFFIGISAGLFYVAYRNIPIIDEYDERTSNQRMLIEQQAAIQNEIAKDVKTRMEDLVKQVGEQNGLVTSFNDKMQTQASTFEEVSATLAELQGSAEDINTTANNQLEGNVRMENIVNEFKDIKIETKSNLNATYANIERVVAQTNVSKQSLDDVERTITRIKDQSAKIGNTISIIVEIADKINLLSLNASIEAARAGDYGKGFAVVADEIGKLASQTTDSIKDIEKVLQDSTKITKEGVDVINKTAELIKGLIGNMVESSNKIKVLQESIMVEEKYINIIIEQMVKNIEMAKNIGLGTEEQKTAIKTTNEAIDHVNNIVSDMVAEIYYLSVTSKRIMDNASELMKRSELAL